MKTLACCIFALGISSSAFGSACTHASLSTYIAEGSCTVGNFTFSNFAFIAANLLTQNAGAGDITVNATVGANGPDVTFTPDSNLQATGVAAAEYLFGFEVTAVTGIIFQSVNLSETGAVTGLSTAAVAEVDCNGGLLQLPNVIDGLIGVGCLGGGPSAGGSVSLPLATSATVGATIQLAGVDTSVDILKDVTLAGILGTASVTVIGQSFTTSGTAVPEPSSLFLGGCGLLALVLVRLGKGKKLSKTNHTCMH